MILILNEWIFHDLLGENGVEAQQEAVDFLRKFHLSCHKLVIPKEPRWTEKAHRLMTQNRFQTERYQQAISLSDQKLGSRDRRSQYSA